MMYYQSFDDEETDIQNDSLFAQQQTVDMPVIEHIPQPDLSSVQRPSSSSRLHQAWLRVGLPAIVVCFILGGYFLWRQTTSQTASPPTTSTFTSSLSSSTTATTTTSTTSTIQATDTSSGATMQVYIVGAVVHPGVYTLPTNARIYQLVQAAGGTQTDADMAAVNLAARISDGQEIDIPKVGEAVSPNAANAQTTATTATNNDTTTGTTSTSSLPTSSSTSSTTAASGSTNATLPLNINTATETQMRQLLHISSTTAQKIINYRTAHGSFSSVTLLSQVVSKTIYKKIVGEVTV